MITVVVIAYISTKLSMVDVLYCVWFILLVTYVVTLFLFKLFVHNIMMSRYA